MLCTNLIAEMEPIKFATGKLTIEPNIYASIEYDDNIFLDNLLS